jgi:hypothetical protein
VDQVHKPSNSDRLRVFENGVLRRIFGPKGNKLTGVRRKLAMRILMIWYSSPGIVRMVKSRRISGAYSTKREKTNAYRMLMGRLEGRRPVRRTRSRWVHNIKLHQLKIRTTHPRHRTHIRKHRGHALHLTHTKERTPHEHTRAIPDSQTQHQQPTAKRHSHKHIQPHIQTHSHTL